MKVRACLAAADSSPSVPPMRRRLAVLSVSLLAGIAVPAAPLSGSLPALLRATVSSTGQAREASMARLREEAGPRADVARVLRSASPLPASSRLVLATILAERGAPALMPDVIASVGRQECSVQFGQECSKALGVSAVPFLVAQATAESAAVRHLVAHGLGLYQDQCPESVAPLCQLAGDEDQDTAVSALFSLRVFGKHPEACGSVVRRLLVDPRPLVRLAAIESVPWLAGPDPACIRRLLAVAPDPALALAERKAAIDVLGSLDPMKHPRALGLLVRLLDNPEQVIRGRTLSALAQCRLLPDEVGDRLLRLLRAAPAEPGISVPLSRCPTVYAKATPLILKQLEDPDVAVRRGAAAYFDHVAWRGDYKLDSATRKALLPSLHSKDIHVRRSVVGALQRCAADPEVRKALRKLMRREPNRRIQMIIESTLSPRTSQR